MGFRGWITGKVSPEHPESSCLRSGGSPERVSVLAAAVFSVALAANAAAQDGVASDRAALEALYDATAGAGGTDSTNWRTPAPLDEWYGVATDAAGRVTGLHLAENGLAGSIPSALGNLAKLQSLDLARNELSGPIPASLGRLYDLEGLHLWWNALTGPIPATLGNLANLKWLELSGNALTGPIPAVLGNLASLRGLDLGGNALTGPIPPALGRLADLELLWLFGNELSGPIPARRGLPVRPTRRRFSTPRVPRWRGGVIVLPAPTARQSLPRRCRTRPLPSPARWRWTCPRRSSTPTATR